MERHLDHARAPTGVPADAGPAGAHARTPRAARPSWRHRLALATAAATGILIVAGGLVTNTGAALAVPDWPTTFGRNMFLFPWSRMVGGVFYEHSHRLLGAAVGVLSVAFAAATWLTEGRAWVRRLALLAVGLVCAQGLVGGLRVLLLRETLAIVHGCLAQAFFALTVALTVFTSRGWQASPLPRAAREARRTAWLAGAVSLTLYAEIVLGALATHAGWIMVHVVGAVVAVAVTATAAARVLARHSVQRSLTRPARLLAALLGVQVTLGLGAYVARFTTLPVPGGAAGGLALPVAHRLTASLLLGAAVALMLHAWRLAAAHGDRHEPRPAPALSRRVPV